MSIISSELLLGSAEDAAFFAERSLRFNSLEYAYAERSLTATGNRRTYTISCWVKTGTQYTTPDTSSQNCNFNFFSVGQSSAVHTQFRVTGGYLQAISYNTSQQFNVAPADRTLFDGTAFYHIVFAVDTTQATASNRVKLYVNGELLDTTGSSFPTQNLDTFVNFTGMSARIAQSHQGIYYSGYLSEFYLIDGQSLTPSSFADYDVDGTWVPIKYTGSYGTNGLYLNFQDNASVSAVLADKSGNSNNFTGYNLSVTPGEQDDSFFDVPSKGTQTDTGVGGEVSGNYCLFAINSSTKYVLKNCGTNVVPGSSGDWSLLGSMALPVGKWYWEHEVLNNADGGNYFGVGVADVGTQDTKTRFAEWGCTWNTLYGAVYLNGFNVTSTGHLGVVGDIIGVAYDADNLTIKFYVNNTLQTTQNLTANRLYAPFFWSKGTTSQTYVNFGAKAYTYTAPSGYKAVCSVNCPYPIIDGTTGQASFIYTGTAASNTISGLNFSPDFTWLKSRVSGASGHTITDIVRGPSISDYMNSNVPESTQNTLTSFNSDGITISASSSVNYSGFTYAGWVWDAGTSTTTNTAGTIPVQLRANPTYGFSIATYTGNGISGATTGHGLGVRPGYVLTKPRTFGIAYFTFSYYYDWGQNHSYMVANQIGPAAGWGASMNATTITRTNNNPENANGQPYISYHFAPVPGYSAMGLYDGASGSLRAYVSLGFRPKFILLKNTINNANWLIYDDNRLGYNPKNYDIIQNSSAGDSTTQWLRILSNGFQIQTSDLALNTVSNTYFYMAFAEKPFGFEPAFM